MMDRMLHARGYAIVAASNLAALNQHKKISLQTVIDDAETLASWIAGGAEIPAELTVPVPASAREGNGPDAEMNR